MKKINRWILILIFILGLIFGKKDFLKNKDIKNELKDIISPTIKLNQDENFYQVVNVVDGDTLDVEINGQIKRIRVIGINTPELKDPRKPVECFAQEASQKAKELLLGKKIRLETDSTQADFDKYGRLLRYVKVDNGQDFGLLMIKEGYAFEYTYNIPYKKQVDYKLAQEQARENKKGLWADNECIKK
ncbi:MAG: hypothetical protein Fur009_0830 [Candidatus Microgenomates bacterium]